MITYTLEELARQGFKEVRPGEFKRISPKAIKEAQKEKKTHAYSKIKKGYYTVGGKEYKFRSKAEYIYAQYLEWLKKTGNIKDWEYESQTFWFKGIKRGCVSYLPDFKVFELKGSHYFVEVKGYMDKKSATKLKRMEKYYPEEKIMLVRSEEIKEIRKLAFIKDAEPRENAKKDSTVSGG